MQPPATERLIEFSSKLYASLRSPVVAGCTPCTNRFPRHSLPRWSLTYLDLDGCVALTVLRRRRYNRQLSIRMVLFVTCRPPCPPPPVPAPY